MSRRSTVHAALMGAIAALLLPNADVRAAAPEATRNPQAESAVAGQPNISGIWSVNEFAFSGRPIAERLMKTLEGAPAPLQPWAQALYDERARLSEVGTPFAGPPARCLPNGVPLGMYDAPYGIQIIQSPGQVTLLHEEPGDFRIIRLNEEHPADIWASYAGHSVGHFEGDTLVVDTVSLKADATMDTLGMPHSDKLRVTERIRRLQPDTLEILFTFDDPGAFTRPWQFRRTYRLWPPGQQILEYVCLENQRNSPDEDGKSKFGE